MAAKVFSHNGTLVVPARKENHEAGEASSAPMFFHANILA
jgi:hypothetical protein